MHVICVTTHTTRSPINSAQRLPLVVAVAAGRCNARRRCARRTRQASRRDLRIVRDVLLPVFAGRRRYRRCLLPDAAGRIDPDTVRVQRQRREFTHRSDCMISCCVCVMLCSGLPPHDWASEFV